jgi:hypothetical protein
LRNASYAARFSVGFSARVFFCGAPSATSSASATRPAMSACTWNTSVMDASNGCCQVVAAVPTWISSGLTRTRLPAVPFSHRTVPVSR